MHGDIMIYCMQNFVSSSASFSFAGLGSLCCGFGKGFTLAVSFSTVGLNGYIVLANSYYCEVLDERKYSVMGLCEVYNLVIQML